MHLSRADLNLFVVFDTLCAEGSVTRAARRLNLSQPAISHALGRLRRMFDDPLFARRGRAMTPTPLARQMIDPVREVASPPAGGLARDRRNDSRRKPQTGASPSEPRGCSSR